MKTLADVLLDVENKNRKARDAQWSEYRELLETPAKNPAKLVALMESLSVSPEQARQHAESLARHGEHVARVERLTHRQQDAAAHDPIVDAFIQKRDQTLAALDLEGNPILAKAQELEEEIRSLTAQVQWGRGREAAAHPELFGVDMTPKPPVRQPSENEIIEGTRLAAARARFESWVGHVLDRPDAEPASLSRANLEEVAADAIEEGLVAGTWEVRGKVFTRDMLPEALRTDPRQAKAIGLKNRLLNEKGLTRQDLFRAENSLLDLAFRFGWIDRAELPACHHVNPNQD